jgi:hypothetical protein
MVLFHQFQESLWHCPKKKVGEIGRNGGLTQLEGNNTLAI